MPVGNLATLLFDETAGAGIYTARLGIPAGAVVTNVVLIPLAAPWDATTADLDMGDTLTAPDSYFQTYDVTGFAAAFDPTAPLAGTNFDAMPNAGNDYKDACDPQALGGPSGIVYAAADVLVAVLTTTGGGGTTGLLAVQVVGYGIGGATHRAVKV